MEIKNINVCETFPDGTPIDGWFYDTNVPSLEKIGKQYVLTAYGILDDGKLYTKEIQAFNHVVKMLQHRKLGELSSLPFIDADELMDYAKEQLYGAE